MNTKDIDIGRVDPGLSLASWTVPTLLTLLHLAFTTPVSAQTTTGDALFHYPDTTLTGAISGTLNVPLENCRRICIERTGCVGFDHSTQDNACRVFSSVELAHENRSSVAATRSLIDGYKAPSNPPGPAPETECDRLAADPYDRDRLDTLTPVYFARLDGPRGIAACEDAVVRYPQASRFAHQLGRAYDKLKLFDRAMEHYRDAAKKGYAASMLAIGGLYYNGDGVGKDVSEALAWYQNAVDHGNTEAMDAIGTLYLEGEGVPQSDAEAVRWFQRGADLHDATAIASLGRAYRLGQGVKKDQREALRLYRLSAEMGSPNGMNNLAFMHQQGFGTKRDYSEAARLYRQAIELADDNAANWNLGLMHISGAGVNKSADRAAELFENAIRGGLKQGRTFLNKRNFGSPEVRRAIQRRLKNAGVYGGAIDGDFGPGTQRAFDAIFDVED